MRVPRAGIAAILAASIAWTGCALLIPPSWRGRAPLPLAGPIDTTAAAADHGSLDPASLSEARLLELLESDRSRLAALTSASERGDDAEFREIADRLPRLLRELERRGTRLPGSRIRHPVIR